MLEEEEFLQADIYLTPPNDGLLSDEDSDDEEGASADHLSGPQLSAAAEYRINYGNSVINSLETDASPDEEALVSSTNVSDSALSLSVCEQEENSLLILKPTTSCISWKKKIYPKEILLIRLQKVHSNSFFHQPPFLIDILMKKP